MRLTVKSAFEVETRPNPRRCRLTVQPDTTVLLVKAHTLKEFQWDTVLVPEDIVLSLNKREAIGSDETRVMDCGVCNGDILWILPPEGHALVKEASKKPRKAVDTTTPAAPPVQKQTVKVAVSKPELRGRRKLASIGVARLLHVACVESGLEPILQEEEVTSAQDTDQLAYCMREASFLPNTSEISEDPSKALVKFVCTPMGETIVICTFVQMEGHQGRLSTHFGGSTNIAISSWFSTSSQQGFCVKSEEKLITELKLKACSPAMLKAADLLGRSLRVTLMALPDELIWQIFMKLDVQSILSLSMTCHHLNRLASCDSLWTYLYATTFSDSLEGQNLEGKDVKQIFRMEWVKRKKDNVFERPFFVDRPRRVPDFLVFPPAFPGITGGDADRLPLPIPRFRYPDLLFPLRHPRPNDPRRDPWGFR